MGALSNWGPYQYCVRSSPQHAKALCPLDVPFLTSLLSIISDTGTLVAR
jgi:hypothetical protein